MSSSRFAPEEIAAEMSAAVLRGDVERALSLISPDAVDHSPLPGAPAGHSGWLAKWAAMASAADGVSMSVEQRICVGDTVATRYRITAADDGQLVGFALEMVRVDNEEIVEHWAMPMPQPLS